MAGSVVAEARRIADDILRPLAEHTDVHGVPRSHIDALTAAGLMGLHAPKEWGGSDATAADARAVHEALAGADASTWFVFTQHHTPVRTLLRSTNDDAQRRWLRPLANGEMLAGVAFTHLRREGPPALVAHATDGGWRIEGTIAWLTSWELADVFLLGAQAGDTVVWVLAPLRDRPEVTADPLALAAMNGTSTVSVRLRDLLVSDADVALVEPLTTWRATDAARSADVSPAVFGVATEAIRRLAEHADVSAVVDSLHEQLADIRARAYSLIDATPAGARIEERLALRAQAQALACRATAALVAAGAGRSMLRGSAAQRLAREALFLLVQGQTSRVRDETLRTLAR